MWKILQELLIWFVGLFVLTQVLLPIIIVRLRFFWILKKDWLDDIKSQEDIMNESLRSRFEMTSEDVDRVRERVTKLREETKEEFDKAKDLKKKTDNLL